jgi:trehalose 6-phosphate phosphatase
MRTVRPLLDELGPVCARLDMADRILVALDYDGTLAPIASTPEAAVLPDETEAVLSEIAGIPGYTVAIVSGRSLVDLRQRVGANAILVGNHGLEIAGGGISFVHEGAALTREVIEYACWDLEAVFLAVRGVRIERKGLGATVHYRNAPAELEEWIRETAEATVRRYLPLVFVAPAIQAVEIRPRLAWNKGSAIRILLDHIKALHPGLVCAGDDATDEDMFGVLPRSISIKVGELGKTRASFHVSGVPELLRFLEHLASHAAMSRRATVGLVEGVATRL